MNAPCIRVRFITAKGFVSGAIRRLTGSLFSHVEFGTPGGTWIGAHIGGGIQERAGDYCTPSLEYVYEIPCTAEEQADFLTWARSQIGTKYDVWDIIGLALQMRKVHRLHEYICSEFYGQGMLRIFGAKRFLNVDWNWTYRITPETGHLSPILVGNRVKP